MTTRCFSLEEPNPERYLLLLSYVWRNHSCPLAHYTAIQTVACGVVAGRRCKWTQHELTDESFWSWRVSLGRALLAWCSPQGCATPKLQSDVSAKKISFFSRCQILTGASADPL